MNYLYFRRAANTGVVVPVENIRAFLQQSPLSGQRVEVVSGAMTHNVIATTEVNDVIKLNTTANVKEVIKKLCQAANENVGNPHGGFTVVADDQDGVYYSAEIEAVNNVALG